MQKKSKNEQKHLKIGELAKLSGIAVSAIRYYQEVKLLEPNFRNDAGYRFYLPSDVSLAKFIKKSQRLGFSLEEIKQILEQRKAGKSPCPTVRSIAKDKINTLKNQIKELQKLEQELQDFIVEAKKDLNSGPNDQEICALIDSAEV